MSQYLTKLLLDKFIELKPKKINHGNKLLKSLSILLVAFSLYACGDAKEIYDNTKQLVDEAREYEGAWQSQGSGLILNLTRDSAEAYEITNVSCLRIFEGTQDTLTEVFVESFTVNSVGELVAPSLTSTETLFFDKLATLPNLCANNGTDFTSDPEHNFEVFWHTFNEHYTYFTERGIDWQRIYSEYRAEVDANTTDAQLFSIFAEILTPFKDAHISIEGGGFSFDGSSTPEFNKFYNRANDPRALDIILSNYLNNDFKMDEQSIARWGSIDESIGYINFRKFGGFAGNSQYGSDHDEKFMDILHEIFNDFQNKDSIVIDVRNNSGGGDGRVLKLASVFANDNTLLYSEKTRHEGGFTPTVDFYSSSVNNLSFAGKIVVLTSPISVSSAEQLAINLLPVSQATIVGQNTFGALSQFSRVLPNGWVFKLTNQVVIAANGDDYEVIGVPPHVQSISFSEADLDAGIDSTLDTAIDVLN